MLLLVVGIIFLSVIVVSVRTTLVNGFIFNEILILQCYTYL